jgi:hypothetical protein
MVADDTGFAYDHACAVVNAEMLSDLSPGVDVDACVRVGELSDDAGNYRYAEFQQ